MGWIGVDYLRIIVMYISPNLFWWKNKLIYNANGLRLRTFPVNVHSFGLCIKPDLRPIFGQQCTSLETLSKSDHKSHSHLSCWISHDSVLQANIRNSGNNWLHLGVTPQTDKLLTSPGVRTVSWYITTLLSARTMLTVTQRGSESIEHAFFGFTEYFDLVLCLALLLWEECHFLMKSASICQRFSSTALIRILEGQRHEWETRDNVLHNALDYVCLVCLV